MTPTGMIPTRMTADEIIVTLGMHPHPEGGHYVETFRSPAPDGQRAALSAIHFLLKAGERSHWHRVDADEVWLWHAGAPLSLRIAETYDGPAIARRLGPTLPDEAPQIVVPAHHWQSATSTGDWTLVSCLVAPAFEFEGFELAETGVDIE